MLECGGTLSHGAVVAREMGLPAVVLPDATRLFADGEEIRVDGRHGAVGRAAEFAAAVAAGAEEPQAPKAADPSDTHLPRELIPPPPGRRERRAGRVRNVALAVWGVYLLLVFLLPETALYRPSIAALDAVLWPLVRAAGKPFTVALVAGALAAATMLVQFFWTDNTRLREAKIRAALLKHEANELPKDSPRRAAMNATAAPVQWRTLAAAMLPIALLLGPMVMTFFWFPARVDPASWTPDPGSAVSIVATVDSAHRDLVTLAVPDPLSIDPATPAAKKLPPLHATLVKLLAQMQAPAAAPDKAQDKAQDNPRAVAQAEAEHVVRQWSREAAAASLKAYLDAGIPPQSVSWTVRAPEGAVGRYPVSVYAGGSAPVTLRVVLGDRYPPAPTAEDGPANSPLKGVKVVYPKPKQEPSFWPALETFQSRWLPAWFNGWVSAWLLLYLLAYLPVLFLLRWTLRIA